MSSFERALINLDYMRRGLWTDYYAPEKENPCGDWTRKEFVYNRSKPLDGIIAHLTREYGGNVHDKGIVHITESTYLSNSLSHHPKNAADLETDSDYESEIVQSGWICYDFKERRVIPTVYSIRTHKSNNDPHLKSWVIEVSNDWSLWRVIDRQDNDYDLNAPYVTRSFKISNVPSEGFRFICLTKKGLVWEYSYIHITGDLWNSSREINAKLSFPVIVSLLPFWSESHLPRYDNF